MTIMNNKVSMVTTGLIRFGYWKVTQSRISYCPCKMLSASIDDFVKKPDFGNHFPVIHGRSFVGVVKLFLLPVIKKKKKRGGGHTQIRLTSCIQGGSK